MIATSKLIENGIKYERNGNEYQWNLLLEDEITHNIITVAY